jgi:hypothetical protein
MLTLEPKGANLRPLGRQWQYIALHKIVNIDFALQHAQCNGCDRQSPLNALAIALP